MVAANLFLLLDLHPATTWLAGIFAAIIMLAALSALVVAALSRHRKSGTGPFQVLGATGRVTTPLQPEGAVLLNGELWPARAADATTLAQGTTIKVVGAQGSLLLVKSADTNSA